jgi:undecaprenyl-diphosphatase
MDRDFALWINSPVGRWPFFDQFMVILASGTLVKMGPLLAIVVAFWFRRRSSRDDKAQLLTGLAGALVALVLARVLQRASTWTLRPLQALPELNLPENFARTELADRSSFPSDTTTLAIAISTIIFVQNRMLGFAWSAVIVMYPRLYLGLHYISDVLAGIVLGAGSVLLATLLYKRGAFLVTAVERRPDWSASLAFLFLFAMGTMFNDVRTVLFFVLKEMGLGSF